MQQPSEYIIKPIFFHILHRRTLWNVKKIVDFLLQSKKVVAEWLKT